MVGKTLGELAGSFKKFLQVVSQEIEKCQNA